MVIEGIKNNTGNQRFEIVQRNNLIGYTSIKPMTSHTEILNTLPSWEVNVNFNTYEYTSTLCPNIYKLFASKSYKLLTVNYIVRCWYN